MTRLVFMSGVLLPVVLSAQTPTRLSYPETRKADVVDDFIAEYAAGRTPNPCMRCNERIKFAALLEKALALGFDAVATGHYAKIVTDAAGNRELHRASAEAKDQSHRQPNDAGARQAADLCSAQAKLFAANAAWDAADRAVQVFGGRGWSTLYRPGRHLQDVRVCRIYEGTDEILKLKVAAAVLGGKEWEAYK